MQSAEHWWAYHENSIHCFPNTSYYAFRGKIDANRNPVIMFSEFVGFLFFFFFLIIKFLFSFVLFKFQGTPPSAKDIPHWVIFSPLLLLQGVGVLFAACKSIEKIVLLVYSGDVPRSYSAIASKAFDCFGFFHHGARYQFRSDWLQKEIYPWLILY